MSNYDYLGRDEQERSNMIMQIVSPSDMDRVALEMRTTILDYYPGLDYLNPTLWKRLGAIEGSRTNPFIRHYMQIASEKKDYIRDDNLSDFRNWIRWAYPADYSEDDINDFTKALLDLSKKDRVPDTILKPWTYEGPTTIMEDFGNAAAGAAKKAVLPIGTLIILGIGVAVFASGGYAKLPDLLRKRK